MINLGQNAYRLQSTSSVCAQRADWRPLPTKADATIVLNESERALLKELVPTATVYQIGLPIDIPTDNSITWDSRRDIVFVGGFNHPPNADAVLYFVHEVWPILREQGYSDRFVIVGSNMPIDIKSLGKDQIVSRGYVEDLAEAFVTARVSVAPLRFGAGLKGKVASSLGYGVPCVTTSIGVEGSGLLDRVNILVGDTPQDLASHILRRLQRPSVLDRTLTKRTSFLSRQLFH